MGLLLSLGLESVRNECYTNEVSATSSKMWNSLVVGLKREIHLIFLRYAVLGALVKGRSTLAKVFGSTITISFPALA